MVKFFASWILVCGLSWLPLSSLIARDLYAFAGKAPQSVSSPAVAETVWIVRSDGAQSCSPKSGETLEAGAEELRKNKVHVLESQKGSDGKMHMQMCGAPTGSTNAYLIPRSDLPQALALGFIERVREK